LCSIGGENATISCTQCGNVFEIQNLVGNINATPPKALPGGYWFFKYNNDDIRIGVSLQSRDVISTLKALFMPFAACIILLLFILPYPDVFFGSPAMTSITLAWLIPAALYAICITVVLLFGKFEFCISPKGSYSFAGLFQFGFKKQFLWNDVNKIYCEHDIISIVPYKMCLRGKKLIKINLWHMLLKNTDILFVESALNYLLKTKHKVVGET
jgi:hypothetical protein